jgi:hypothetical protein
VCNTAGGAGWSVAVQVVPGPTSNERVQSWPGLVSVSNRSTRLDAILAWPADVTGPWHSTSTVAVTGEPVA